MLGLVSPAAGPKLRLKPSNGAPYKQPREGEFVLAGKTERSLAFRSTKAGSESTWTFIVNLSKRETPKREKLFKFK